MDQWEAMSPADKRRWALNFAGIGIRCGDATTSEAIAAAEAIVAYVSSGENPPPQPVEAIDAPPLHEAA